jgi:putative transposase
LGPAQLTDAGGGLQKKDMANLDLDILRKTVEKWLKEEPEGWRKERLEFLLRWDSGIGVSALAREFGLHRTTVWLWQRGFLKSWEEHPVNALEEWRESRRPAHRAEELRAALSRIPPEEMTSSVRLAKKLQIPERTVRRYLAPVRASTKGCGSQVKEDVLEVPTQGVDNGRVDGRFTSGILPPSLRLIPTVENLIPMLYLNGLSMSELPAALGLMLGPKSGGLSSSDIVCLIERWQDDYTQWLRRDLSGERIVYVWADGIFCNVRLPDERPCLLVVVGAREDGTKVLLTIADGERESKQSWQTVLLDLKARGLKVPPKLAVADGAMGFWPALEQVWPGCVKQCCWVHKTVNVLDKLPKKLQPEAKERLHAIWQGATRGDAVAAFDRFLQLYQAKHDQACQCLRKDRDDLLKFYDFPAQHWIDLRTTNPIESSFAPVRYRARQTESCGSRNATLAMMFKLGIESEKSWRRLNGHSQISRLIEAFGSTASAFVSGFRRFWR